MLCLEDPLLTLKLLDIIIENSTKILYIETISRNHTELLPLQLTTYIDRMPHWQKQKHTKLLAFSLPFRFIFNEFCVHCASASNEFDGASVAVCKQIEHYKIKFEIISKIININEDQIPMKPMCSQKSVEKQKTEMFNNFFRIFLIFNLDNLEQKIKQKKRISKNGIITTCQRHPWIPGQLC